MKVNLEVDCTPEEARAFFGLPDLRPMQAAVTAKLQAQMLDAADRFSPDSVLRSWLSLMPMMPEQIREMAEAFLRSGKPPGAARDET